MPQNQSLECDNLIIDGNNLCYINFFANKEAGDDEFLGLTFSYCFAQIKNLYKKFSPKKIIIAFDSTSWRKAYTAHKDLCITHKKYKATRRQKLEPAIRRRIETLEPEITNFANFLKNHTSCLVLQAKLLEADDLISGFIHKHEYEDNIIISSDKDFMQLLKNNTRLYNPVEEKFRDLSEYDNDHKLFLFEKCFRGDTGDNVISSYPRLLKKKIKTAYTDDFIKNNIMNHEFEVEELLPDATLVKYKYKTADLFEENMTLMSLYDQPDEIKELINSNLDASLEIRNKFGLFEFLKFCGKYKMENTIKFVEQYIPSLNLKVI